MARRCRRIVCRKRVRRLEVAGGSQSELVDLRAEQQALYERLRAMEQENKEIKQRAIEQEDKERLRLMEQNKRQQEEQSSRQDETPLESSRFSRKPSVEDCRKKTLVDEGYKKQSTDDVARSTPLEMLPQVLENLEQKIAFQDAELRSLKQSRAEQTEQSRALTEQSRAQAEQIRSLQDALHRKSIAASHSSPPQSSGGEPCSEPSMQSSRAGFGDDEAACLMTCESIHGQCTATGRTIDQQALVASREHIVEKVASPQRRNGCTRDDHDMAHLSKAERVLGRLQHALCRDDSEDDIEAYLSQLVELTQKDRIKGGQKDQVAHLAIEAAQRYDCSLKIRHRVVKLLELESKDGLRRRDMGVRGNLERLHFGTQSLCFLLDLIPCHTGYTLDDVETRDVFTSCFRMLSNLGQDPSLRAGSDGVLRDALEAVLRCLSVPLLRDQTVISTGAYLVKILVDNCREHQELVRKNGGLPLLLKLLDAEVKALENECISRPLDATRVVEQKSSTLCLYVVGCLAKVVEDNEANRKAVYEDGGIELLLRTLKTCLYAGNVVGNVCSAIAFIANADKFGDSDEGTMRELNARSQGAVALIIDALIAHSEDRGVQVGVYRAIVALTDKHIVNQQAFLDARLPDRADTGLVALLLEALRKTRGKPEEEPLVLMMCWTLENLTIGNPPAMDLVQRLQGLPVVLRLFKCFQEEERACHYICRLVSSLANGPSVAAQKNREELLKLGAATAINKTIQLYAQTDGLMLVRGMDALQSLGLKNQ